MREPELTYGTCVAVAGAGVLLRGPPGSGKSDLALRLMDGGGQLVSDDQCLIGDEGGKLHVTAPQTIQGLIEVRGLGVVQVQAVASAPLAMVVDLVAKGAEPHLPAKGTPLPTTVLAGHRVPCLQLWAFAASSPAKIRMAVHALRHNLIVTDKGISGA